MVAPTSSLMAKSCSMRRNAVSLYVTVLHQTAAMPACTMMISTVTIIDNHMDTWESFKCGYIPGDAWLHISDKILVLHESRDGPLVAVQCFKEPQGLYVTVNCIAPSTPEVARFSYHLSYSHGGKKFSFGLGEMNRIQNMSFQTPGKDFMCVPYYFLDQRANLKMKICIRRLGEEEGKEEHDGDKVVDKVRRSNRERKANSMYQDKVK